MRRFLLIILSILFSLQLLFGQTKAKTPASYPSLQKQADKMVSAIVSNDFETFTNFMYPKLVNLVGGRDKFIELSRKSLAESADAGVSILDYQVKKPVQMLRVKSEIFAVLPTVLRMKMLDKELLIKGSILGISGDNGKNWTFIRVEEKEAVRPILPNVIDKLKIPKQTIS